MDFHGKSENVIITDIFPFEEEKENRTISYQFPSLYNRFENGMFMGFIASAIISPPLEYQTPEPDPEQEMDKLSDFVMAKVEYKEEDVEKKNPIFYRTTRENMPDAEEFENQYGFKMYRFKTEDNRTKYFCDNINLSKEEALKKWKLGYPLVSFIQGTDEKPKTYFPSKCEDKPNLFLIILANISNMDFMRISTIKNNDVKDFLTANGMKQYKNLVKLSEMLEQKPGFLERKYNGFLIHNKKNLQSLLLNPPPRFGQNVSKWKALDKIVKMIIEHH